MYNRHALKHKMLQIECVDNNNLGDYKCGNKNVATSIVSQPYRK